MMQESIPLTATLNGRSVPAALRDLTDDEQLATPQASKIVALVASPSMMAAQEVEVGGRARRILRWQPDPVSDGVMLLWIAA